MAGGDAQPTKRQMRETKPIPREFGVWSLKCEVKNETNFSSGPIGRSAFPRVNRAKQTQRAVVGSQLSVVGWRTAAPNKANLLGVKTRDKRLADKELW